MPIFKAKNENFFKSWSHEMAYVLGFFTADGNLTINPSGSHYLEFTSCDIDIITKIRRALSSNHKISVHRRKPNWSKYYRLQIGSKEMFMDLVGFGITVNKSKTIKFPYVPSNYLSSFLLGYFDGDGNVVCGSFRKSDRMSKSPVLSVRFTSGSEFFLRQLKDRLRKELRLSGSIHNHDGWRLVYSTCDSRILYKFFYMRSRQLFLERKRVIFLKDSSLANYAGVA